jgi:LPS export ABC transporter protein LptC
MSYYQFCLFLSLLLVVSGCGKEKTSAPPATEINITNPDPQDNQSRLVFRNITLEQADNNGQTLWKIQAEQASYTQEKKVADLEKLAGNLYQDGEIVLKISADRGKIEENGEIIWLEGGIVALDPRNKIEIQSERAQWKPKENMLIVDTEIRANHPQLEVSAQKGRYFTKEEKLVLNDNILAKAIKSAVQLKTQQLTWNIKEEKIIGDRPLDIAKYKNNTVTDRLQAGKGDMNLKTETAYLTNNLEFNSVDPPLQIATKTATWQINSRIITTSNPITIIDKKQQATVTGNRGSINLDQQIARLSDGVSGSSMTQTAKLYSTKLIWDISQELFTAEGNVIYQQTDPEFVATGDKAVGKLTEKNITVSSNQGARVVTEIIPNEEKRN